MSESTRLNGHVNPGESAALPKRAPARKAQAAKRSPRRRSLSNRRKLAILGGAVGTGMLALSVVHCCEAIQLLTGSHWALAGLMAVGIDAGMVTSELGELVSVGSKGEHKVRPWARAYLAGAVGISCLLNAYAFGLHAPAGMVWAAWALGVAIPVGIFVLGKWAAQAWLGHADAK